MQFWRELSGSETESDGMYMELRIEHLTKSYGEKVALNDFTVTLSEGLYGLLGPNGAGKSTLMKLLTDSITRTKGDIWFDGEDVLKLGRKYRNEIGYMPQQQGLYESFSGRAFLKYMADLKDIPKKQAAKQIEELLQIVNLQQDAHRKCGKYSGGMKQRLLLAQALLGDPKILLLDEPTAGLDPEERIRLRNYIHELGKNRIVLLSTHIVADVETIADQVILMKEGSIKKMGTPAALMEEVTPYITEPVTGRISLEDVYLYYIKQ